MSESLWDCTADQLLRRASSTDPTPGGGAIAALTAAFGLGLVRMAVDISSAGGASAGGEQRRLADARSNARELQAQVAEAVDRDVEEFEAMMVGYRMPRDTDEQRSARQRAIADATVTATHGPLRLAELAVAGIALADEIESSVKSTIVSDVQAGRDLLRGAALAALRTADINLAALEQRSHAEAPALRRRRDAVRRAAADVEERG
ncbi:MAG: cyclodeaminase/cyclohydrolase family protein [Solirubrobacteraceae bacterium]